MAEKKDFQIQEVNICFFFKFAFATKGLCLMPDFWHFEFENWPNGIFDKWDLLNQMALLQATLTQQWALKRKAQVGKGHWIQMFPEKKLFAQKLALC